MATPTINDTGVWTEYFPDVLPVIPGVPADSELPSGVKFTKNADGVDWYVFRATWPADTLCAMAWPRDPANPNSLCVLQSVLWGAADSAVPFGCRVLQISGWDPADVTPWKGWQFKVYDPNTKLVMAADLSVSQVDSTQAKIQLSRMKMADGKTTVLQALTTLLLSADVETNLWFSGAKSWRIDDPNVQKLGKALGLSGSAMQDAFNKADLIRVN